MNLSEILSVNRVRLGLEVASKKRALETLSELLASCHPVDPALSPRVVRDALIARERLGSTGLGHGVALPHGRLPDFDHTTAAFVRLADGVDFDAPDGAPVDLLFGLLVPEQSTEVHLEILAAVARALNEPLIRERLRRADSAEEALELLASEGHLA
jgi:PTS system nitrogen regulatory IIA component